VTARIEGNGAAVEACMVYERESVTATGIPKIEMKKELDLVFCVDTTGSMVQGGHLERLRQQAAAFVGSLPESEMDIRLAAISFGDRAGGERETVYSFTSDKRLFITRLNSLNENDGGDEPESSLDALGAAQRLPFREGSGARRHVVLVTDAPPQKLQEGSLESLVSDLGGRQIRVDIVGPFCKQYDTVVHGTGGRHYDIDDDMGTLFTDLEEIVRQAQG